MNSSNKVIYWLIFIVLIWYHCFSYVGMSAYVQLFNGVCYMGTVGMFLYSAKYISFKKYMLPTLILASTIISMFMSMVLWSQSPMEILKSFRTYYLVLVFFFLCRMKAREDKIETTLMVLALIYIVCWAYQIYKVPELVFGIDRDNNLDSTEQRGFFRFWIPTKENMPILVLLMYEFYRRTKKFMFLILSALCFIVVILHVGRQMIFWSFVSIVMLILYHNRRQWKKIALSSVILYFLGVALIDNIPTISLLLDQTALQMEDSENDIRKQCIEFYLNKSISNPVGFLLGNGIGYTGNLGAFTAHATQRGFYESDIGFVALLFDFGLLGLLTYVFLFIKILKMRVAPQYIYLKCYFIYVYGSYALAHSLTTNIFFNMCALYILYTSNKKFDYENTNSFKVLHSSH